MSIVEITEHNECVFNLKKRELPKVAQTVSYQSKYRKKIADEKATNAANKSERRTFGYAEVPLAGPSDFLKKHSHKPVILPLKRAPSPGIKAKGPKGHKQAQQQLVPQPSGAPCCQKADCPHKKPHKRDNGPKKNFLRENILHAVHLVPPKPKKVEVFTRFGAQRRVEPVLVTQSRYAKMPSFLDEFKPVPPLDIQGRSGDLCAGLQQNAGPQFVCDVERRELLAGLKQNWDAKMKEYNLLPVITDTLRNVHNKLSLESDLKQLEKDIATIEKHPVLYVMDERREFRSA